MQDYIGKKKLPSLLFGMIFLLACGRTPKSTEARASSSVLDALLGPLTNDPLVDCSFSAIVPIRRPPIEHAIPAVGCRGQRADTVRYRYSDSTGRVLVAGEYITVSPGLLRSVLDSIHTVLVSRFGASTTCRENATSAGPIRAWDRDTVALSVWADSLFGFYRVGVEARATEKICDEPMRAPTHP